MPPKGWGRTGSQEFVVGFDPPPVSAGDLSGQIPGPAALVSVLLNLGGFAVLCLFAGPPGRLAFTIYWPAILGVTFAFAALFHLMGACLPRAPVLAILYAFFLETIAGNLPGHLKRLSLSFYSRCLMFDRAHAFGIQPERPGIYLPVSGPVALGVLVGV